jgi:type I site-specific restriction endonuclease
MAKNSNEEKYREIIGEDKIEFIEDEPEEKNIITISQNYLMPTQHVVKFDDSTQFQREVKKFYESENIKCLSLKSPYGSGKTQMIKSLMTTYDPKRILWLSYRKTLTNNVIGGEKFGEEYGFKNYMNGDLSADRLMIQLESTLKLYSEMDFIDENTSIYPSYDLVIIDEIESILSHFECHQTFHGKSKDTFEFIQNVIINSSKLMVLDGDVGNRTYNYIKSFGQCINIVNDIKINKKNFIVTQDNENFCNKISKSVKSGEKVVIVSMSTGKCDTFHQKLKKKFPEKKC